MVESGHLIWWSRSLPLGMDHFGLSQKGVSLRNNLVCFCPHEQLVTVGFPASELLPSALAQADSHSYTLRPSPCFPAFSELLMQSLCFHSEAVIERRVEKALGMVQS